MVARLIAAACGEYHASARCAKAQGTDEKSLFVAYSATHAMQTEEASQYTPRFQSPSEKQAIADPTLQRNKSA